jgi:ribosomal protein S18 acetylase RimI-like enzyme
MVESTLNVQPLKPTDWQELRTARLRALRDSPRAFASRYIYERRWGEPEWRRMFDDSIWLVAREAAKLIGLARSVGEPGKPSCRNLESIWVAPTHRRRGVFRALLDALSEIEGQLGATDLLLWVLEDNQVAQQVYEALGFRPTGESQPLPSVRRIERRLRLGIERPPGSGVFNSYRAADHQDVNLGQHPCLEAEKVHSLSSAADVVDSGREPLPLIDIVSPSIQEVNA